MIRSPCATELIKPQSHPGNVADSYGIVAELYSEDVAAMLENMRGDDRFKSSEALQILSRVKQLGARFGIVAGRLDRREAGFIAIGAGSSDELLSGIEIANLRLAEKSCNATYWAVLVDGDLRERLMESLAEYSGYIGGVQ